MTDQCCLCWERTHVTRSLNVRHQVIPALFIHTSLMWLPIEWLTGLTFSSYFFPFPAKFAVAVVTSHLTKPPDLKNWLHSTPLDNFPAIHPETFLCSLPYSTSRHTLTSCTGANPLFFISLQLLRWNLSNSIHERSKTVTLHMYFRVHLNKLLLNRCV